MKYSYFNVFGGSRFLGNPVCVVELDLLISKQSMQEIAKEQNLPATTFIFKNGFDWEIRWFSTNSEIQLCGHGTLGAASYVFRKYKSNDDEVIFNRDSKQIKCRKNKDNLCEIELVANYPHKDVENFQNDEFGLNSKIISCWKTENQVTLVEVENESQVKLFSPHFEHLVKKKVSLIVTSQSKSCDFVYRYFAPSFGDQEDSATGSAQAILVPFWSGRTNRNCFTSHQVSKLGGYFESEIRGGIVLVRGNCYPDVK